MTDHRIHNRRNQPTTSLISMFFQINNSLLPAIFGCPSTHNSQKQMSQIRKALTVLSGNESNIPELIPNAEHQQQHIEKPVSSLKFGVGTTLFPAEYADDVELYLRQLERRSPLDSDFLSIHKTVDGRMGQILVDGLFMSVLKC